jgi:hypothetical protein
LQQKEMKLEERVRKPFVAFEVDALQFLVKPLPKKKSSKKTAKKDTAPAAKLARQVSQAAEVSLSRQQSAKAEKLFRAGCLSHKWQYKNDSGKWADYDKGASEEVERAYASWLVNPHIDVRSVHSGDWDYMVDFNLLTQQNIRHQAHKVRSIQRIPA